MICKHLFKCLMLFAACASGMLVPVRAAEPGAPSPHAIDIPKWFSESFLELRDDVADAAKQGKRLMLYFGQDGCPYCRTLMQDNFSRPYIVDIARREFVAVALNLWGDREVAWLDGRKLTEKALAAELKVQFTPTLLFFDEQGKVVLRLNGYVPPDKFFMALNYVASKQERKQSFTAYLQAQPGPAAFSLMATESYMRRAPLDFAALFAKRDKPAIVFIEHAACEECKELHREGLQRPEVKRLIAAFNAVQIELHGTRVVKALDGKAWEEIEWARAQNVVYLPTMIFYDAAGKEVFRNEGYLRPFHLATTLDYVASGAYLREPSFQRFIQRRSDALRAQGEDVDLWK
jgi:thioredoxin-related protein